ncbi:MAG: nucleoside deaminase [Lachnospiraceae bacterium]|jgi:tRNA(Arg) A34 adenosine deaminase TadA|nr:nucleoside deaminase [Lachnospiraceae bacterium]
MEKLKPKKTTIKDIMKLGIEEARKTMKENLGGPFGAVIVKDGEVISVSSNHVLANNDPTAHGEVMAIREACQKLGTYDLSGCELYATGYPCPMCLSAAIWANIKKVYVCGMPEDAEEIGFRDDFIYRFIYDKMQDKDVLEIIPTDRKPAQKLYAEYAKMNKTIY